MKIHLTAEKWNLLKQPTAGEKYFLVKKNKKIWFDIVAQGWSKTGVYLQLSKSKKT